MKPFNLQKAKAGKSVCTRSGKPVEITRFNATGEYPLIGFINHRNNKKFFSWRDDGLFISGKMGGHDLMMQEEYININGRKVPKPMDKSLSDENRIYYTPSLTLAALCEWCEWTGDIHDQRCLKRGIVHLTKEAAIIHAKALLSFTREII